jgi:hypothetical protein
MARYYDIRIYAPGVTTGMGTPFLEFTSYPTIGGVAQNDPGALDVLMDIYELPYALPQGNASVEIWGIPISLIGQANQLNSDYPNNKVYTIEIYAGFQAGLPLNKAAQAGLIVSGQIFQAFANWQGTTMTLDLVIVALGAVALQNSQIVLNWTKGTTLAAALKTTFTNAFPGLKQSININQNLVLPSDEIGVYLSLPAFAPYLKGLTAAIIGGSYQGVDIAVTATQITAYDGSTQTTPVQIAFQDLIGQPIWINLATIQFICAMRADLNVNTYIAMPQGLLGNPANPFGAPGAVTTTTASNPQQRQNSIFTGIFKITEVHHMGQFRQKSGDAWVTVFSAIVSLPAVAS